MQLFEVLALQAVCGELAMRSSAFLNRSMAAGWTWPVSVHWSPAACQILLLCWRGLVVASIWAAPTAQLAQPLQDSGQQLCSH